MLTGTRLTALGFAVGSAVHATGLGLFFAGIRWYGPAYPWWRHILMSAADAAVVWVALRRASWLPVVLVAFAAEQFAVNGVQPMSAAIIVAAILVGWERRAGRQPARRAKEA